MKKQLTIAAVAVTTLLGACKKSDDNSNSSKILGKWNVIKAINVMKADGDIVYNDTTVGQPGEYIEFTSGGKAISHELGGSDTSGYKITDTQLLIIDEEDTTSMKILNFTSKQLSLYGTETYIDGANRTNVDETWLDLSK
jgi:hypothetical protein